MSEPVGPDGPERRGPAGLRLPRSWIGRVVLAWLVGLVVSLVLGAVLGGTHFEAGFWTLAAVLAAFVVSDGVRARR